MQVILLAIKAITYKKLTRNINEIAETETNNNPVMEDTQAVRTNRNLPNADHIQFRVKMKVSNNDTSL